VRLDQARIAIRERSWLDNLDLALHVIRAHLGGVIGCTLAGAVPMMAINHTLISWLTAGQAEWDSLPQVLGWSIVLVMIEAPLAMAPLTIYLGQALFVERPGPRRVAAEFAGSLPQLLLFQVLVRTSLAVPIVTWFLPYTFWPYLNEVIVLERNPLSARSGGMSTLKRSGLLHRGNSGDYLARALASALVAIALLVGIELAQTTAIEWLLGLESGWTLDALSLQAALWIVAAYFTVVRFLSYLDQRIRFEGWEVELLLRAQRERLTRQPA
jgi:hypothetical protein